MYKEYITFEEYLYKKLKNINFKNNVEHLILPKSQSLIFKDITVQKKFN